MSYLNRYDHGPKRNGYDPNKNYDANIFNTDTRQPEYVRYNVRKCRNMSTDIAERKIETKIRVIINY